MCKLSVLGFDKPFSKAIFNIHFFPFSACNDGWSSGLSRRETGIMFFSFTMMSPIKTRPGHWLMDHRLDPLWGAVSAMLGLSWSLGLPCSACCQASPACSMLYPEAGRWPQSIPESWNFCYMPFHPLFIFSCLMLYRKSCDRGSADFVWQHSAVFTLMTF